MRISDAGLQFIMHWEGTVLHTYKDSVGISTIGVGHVIRTGESFPDGITQEQAMELLRQDIGTAEAAIDSKVTVDLTQNAYDSLCSFVFNVGTEAFGNSTLLRLLNAGDAAGAADQFLQWDHGGGKVLAGLLNRRKAEREMFLAPDDGASA